MKQRILVSCFVVACCLLGQARQFVSNPTATLVAERTPKGQPVVPGVWSGDFEACKKYAEDNGVPMIAVWSNGEHCGNCKTFEQCLLADPFEEWRVDSGVILYFIHSDEPGGQQKGTIYYWCRPPLTSPGFPFVRFYWYKKNDSGKLEKVVDTVYEGTTIDKNASLTLGNASGPDYKTYNVGSRYVVDFITNKTTGVLRDYSPRPKWAGGEFVKKDVKLYAGKTTELKIELVREENVDVASENILKATAPAVAGMARSVGVEIPLTWSEGETNKTVELTFADSKGGDQLILSLLDMEGNEHAAITNVFEATYMGGRIKNSATTAYLRKAESVVVELTRSEDAAWFGEYESANTLRVDYPDGYGVADTEISVTWGKTDVSTNLTLALDTSFLQTNTVIALSLLDEFGEAAGAATIALVEPPYCGGKFMFVTNEAINVNAEVGLTKEVVVNLTRDPSLANYAGETTVVYDYNGFSQFEPYDVMVSDTLTRTATNTVPETSVSVETTLEVASWLCDDEGKVTNVTLKAVSGIVPVERAELTGSVDLTYAAETNSVSTYENPQGAVTSTNVFDSVKSVVIQPVQDLKPAVEFIYAEATENVTYTVDPGEISDDQTEQNRDIAVTEEGTFAIDIAVDVPLSVTLSGAVEDVTNVPARVSVPFAGQLVIGYPDPEDENGSVTVAFKVADAEEACNTVTVTNTVTTSRIPVACERTEEKSADAKILGEMVYLPQTNTVSFAAGETDKKVTVPLFWGTNVGSRVTVTIADAEYGPDFYSSVMNVTLVESVANSAKNPLWLGERTESGENMLKPGEWTMDLELAKKVAKAEGGKVLIYDGGPLWCPDCLAIEPIIFDSDAFKVWMATNKIYCVTIDQPKAGKDGPMLARGNSSEALDYVTRKMISAEAGEEVAQRCIAYSKGWVLPGEKNQKGNLLTRLPKPTLLLMDGEGTIHARLVQQYDRGAGKYDLEENMRRLDDLLTVFDEEGDQSNQTAQTTTQTYTTGLTMETTLHINDKVDVFEMTDLAFGARVFTVEADRPVALTMTWYEAGDEIRTNSVLTQTSVDGVLVITNSLTNAYLTVSAYTEVAEKDFVRGAMAVKATVTSAMILAPTVDKQTYSAPADSCIQIAVSAGKTYWIYSPVKNSMTVGEGLRDDEDYYNIYHADADGLVEIKFAKSSAVEYRVWDAGTIAFAPDSLKVSCLENSGTGTVMVVRTPGADGGLTGQVKVRVVVDEEHSEAVPGVRYRMVDSEITWDDNDPEPAKSVTFELLANNVFEGMQTFRLRLELVESPDGYVEVREAETAEVAIYDTTMPCFGDIVYDLTFYKDISQTQVFPLYNIDVANRVTFSRIAGTLPPGLRIAYDPKQCAAVISGKPTKVGLWTNAVYSVNEKRRDGTAKTDDAYRTCFNIRIADVTVANEPFGLNPGNAANENFGRALTFPAAPVYVQTNDAKVVAGTLQMSVSRANKISAKYRGAVRSQISFAGYWSSVDADGTLHAELENRYGTLLLELGADGVCRAAVLEYSVSAGGEPKELTADLFQTVWSRDNLAAGYKGQYTVTLPCCRDAVGGGAGVPTKPEGTGWMTLNLTSASHLRNGTVACAGMLANGTTFSSSAVLIPEEDGMSAVLPVFHRTAKDVLGVAMNMVCGGENGGADVAPINILAQNGTCPVWEHTEKDYAFRNELEVYGGYYNPANPLEDCCREYYQKTAFIFSVADEYVELDSAADERLAVQRACESVSAAGTKFLVTAPEKGFTLSLNQKTGVVSGRLPVTLTKANGRMSRTTIPFKGVLLPGWSDCCRENVPERPFVSGAVWYTGRTESGRSVKSSLPFDLK